MKISIITVFALTAISFVFNFYAFAYYIYIKEEKEEVDYSALFKAKENSNRNLFVFALSIQIISFFYIFGVSYEMFILSIVFSLITVGAFIDQEKYILPNKVTFKIIAFGILIMPFNPFIENFLYALIGGITMYVIFFVLSFFGMGYGDVKLMFGLGFFLGIETILLATVLGFIIGSLEGIALWIIKGYKKHMEMPFGPALSLGAFFSILIIYSDFITVYDLLKVLGW